MSDNDLGDYKIGYKKPPKHSQFPPGVSGNKGRRKRETQAEIIARVRDELVEVNGRRITKFELAVTQTTNQTIRSGKPRDLKMLFEILEKYGEIPAVDRADKAKHMADEVTEKILGILDRTYNVDPADVKELERLNREEAQIVLSCAQCGPSLKAGWATESRRKLKERYGQTALNTQVEMLFTPHPTKPK